MGLKKIKKAMHLEARKLHLIEEIFKIQNDEALNQIEVLINEAAKSSKLKRPSAFNFLGLISEEDAALIDAAIEDGCEQINDDDWR